MSGRASSSMRAAEDVSPDESFLEMLDSGVNEELIHKAGNPSPSTTTAGRASAAPAWLHARAVLPQGNPEAAERVKAMNCSNHTTSARLSAPKGSRSHSSPA
ncbi:MAG: hypothetical protein MZV70_13880 [Desulfobacterales bacterium]|nr:hypothetical protein [Desulfobacterales bacterium]